MTKFDVADWPWCCATPAPPLLPPEEKLCTLGSPVPLLSRSCDVGPWDAPLLGVQQCTCWAVTTLPASGHGAQDVNECLDTTACPTYATCTNTVGSYFCTCKRGFRPSNGQHSFSSPAVKCEDIDECVEGLDRCVPHSMCTNLLGRYNCSCLPGFSSPTGVKWTLGNPGAFTCADVDECADLGTCPPLTTCYNTPGSYKCVCSPGQRPGSGQLSPQGSGDECEDIDECADGCPTNATCTHTPRGHFCTCYAGFTPSSGQQNFTDREVQCTDIDECTQDPALCGPNSVCTNALGSFHCGCLVGFRANPGGSQAHGNFSCKRVPFKCREDMIPDNEQVQRCQARSGVKPQHVSFCALMNATFSILDDACEKKTSTVSLKVTTEPLASCIHAGDVLVLRRVSALASVLLASVESSALASLLTPSANASQTIQTEHMAIESRVINEECNEANVSIQLKAKGDGIKIGCSIIEESGSAGTTGVAFVSFAHMESLLDARFFRDPRGAGAGAGRPLRMSSRVVGAIMTGEKKEGFAEPVVYTLENVQPKQKSEKPICVSWSTDGEEGRWTPAGCVILEASELRTVCSCHQMANLAIIMASGVLTMDFSLHVISHVGTALSLACLALAIATFLLCRALRNRNTYLHLHLCVCLFLAKSLFLIGIDKTNNQMGCAIIAGLLHYLFLAAFSWMLVEAVMLFLTVRNLKVVNYFNSRDIRMLHLCAFGYGFPGLVVAISAGAQPQGYGMHNRCWLNTETGFIWSFLGPVCVIITINTVLLTGTLWILRQKLTSVNAEVSTLKDTRLLTFKAFAQVFLLGCSWVLGIFQIGPVATVMAYLFTITNSLQGAFVFLIHCLLNRQVREEYRRWITRKTEPGSQSQTSAVVVSFMPSTAKTD
ncbi:adhesion G protein-coupled receptor E1 [Perognathus longimembris pacificus]|uniref:adhesion G protein-coupled receptor E1 n=1 Tax=Perognathus longimembris pacificus TaxID=214514 RepID=UPI002018FD92|nr:adhesion G protein-coupled receptor E1 [Perognathus longimembris pacificus]